MSTDFVVADHGSIVLLYPATDAAREWVDQHIDQDAQHFGRSVVIEPRYFRDIFEGIRSDGLSIS